MREKFFYGERLEHMHTVKIKCANLRYHHMVVYRIAGNFRGENFRELVKIRFSRRKLSQIARFCLAEGRHAPNFAEKTFAYSHNPRNPRKFSPSKVFRYTVYTYWWKLNVRTYDTIMWWYIHILDSKSTNRLSLILAMMNLGTEIHTTFLL